MAAPHRDKDVVGWLVFLLITFAFLTLLSWCNGEPPTW